MFSGSVRGAVKPITIVAIISLRTVWLRVGERNRLQELFTRFGMNFQAHHFNSVRASFITSSAGNVLAVPLSTSPRRCSDSLSQALSEFGSLTQDPPLT